MIKLTTVHNNAIHIVVSSIIALEDGDISYPGFASHEGCVPPDGVPTVDVHTTRYAFKVLETVDEILDMISDFELESVGIDMSGRRN